MKEKYCGSGSWRVVWLAVLLTVGVIMGSAGRAAAAEKNTVPSDTEKIPIQHVIVIFQENRTFDSYFGTYPGADGIPMRNGSPTVCAPDPETGKCLKPYPNHDDENCGGPHVGVDTVVGDVNEGLMNGFIKEAELMGADCSGFRVVQKPDPKSSQFADQVMGYHVESDIPNYWAYARHFVLQDHMFEALSSWSLPTHLWLVSAWSASCAVANDPMSCVSALMPNDRSHKDPTPFAWTDITYMLDKAHVSWVYYLDHGAVPEDFRQAYYETHGGTAVAKSNIPLVGKGPDAVPLGVPRIWNVLPGFTDVHQDQQLGNLQRLDRFYAAAKAGTLPAVSWIIPDATDSEHPPAEVSVGQSYVTSIVNAVMQSPEWTSTAIFITWDDWGGFYDHVVPPRIDSMGYGIRVPGLMISAYAKHGYIDHQTLSHDAYLKFIEDIFLHGQRLNPKTDGRPDARPYVREDNPQLGNLMQEFDFSQSPRPPLLLPVHPNTTLKENHIRVPGGHP